MSLARLHRDRMAAILTSNAPDTGSEGGADPAASETAPGVSRAAGQIVLRLSHDLRTLKEIKSIDRKIEAKRTMLPEYAAWCDGLLAADAPIAAEDEAARDVLPTMMVWAIDVADWPRALELAAYVLRHDVPLPSRYERDAPSLIVEEVADAAIKTQVAGWYFPLLVLEQVEALTIGVDMHDEIRAKLAKAIGTELARSDDQGNPVDAPRALAALREAQRLHERIGVKDKIKRLEKHVAASAEPAPDTPDVASAASSATAGTVD